MKSAVWVTLTLGMLAFAGCTDDNPLTNDDCLVLGMILDPAVEQVDNETGESFIGPACIEDIPSVTAELQGAPATTAAYSPVKLTWILHTTLAEDHSHNNGVRISKVSDPSYQGKVDGYGIGLLGGNEEHRNFVEGDFSVVTWTPSVPGTYYVRAFAVSAWGNFWAPEHEVTVTEVQATGDVHTVTVSGGGIPTVSGFDPATLDIVLGDEVQWVSGDPPGVTWTISRQNGPDGVAAWTPVTAGGDGVVFKAPGQYRYVAQASAPDGSNIGSQISGGVINVAFPV